MSYWALAAVDSVVLDCMHGLHGHRAGPLHARRAATMRSGGVRLYITRHLRAALVCCALQNAPAGLLRGECASSNGRALPMAEGTPPKGIAGHQHWSPHKSFVGDLAAVNFQTKAHPANGTDHQRAPLLRTGTFMAAGA